jgi:hypothetical protein
MKAATAGFLLAAAVVELVADGRPGVTRFAARFKRPLIVGEQATVTWDRDGDAERAVVRDHGGTEVARASVGSTGDRAGRQ